MNSLSRGHVVILYMFCEGIGQVLWCRTKKLVKTERFVAGNVHQGYTRGMNHTKFNYWAFQDGVRNVGKSCIVSFPYLRKHFCTSFVVQNNSVLIQQTAIDCTWIFRCLTKELWMNLRSIYLSSFPECTGEKIMF